MPSKEEIARTLLETRDARLLMEIGSWTHDLDKATWMFAAFESKMKREKAKYYKHNLQPDRSNSPDKWKWEAWLDELKTNSLQEESPEEKEFFGDLPLAGLLPKNHQPVELRYCDRDNNTTYAFNIEMNSGGHPSGSLSSLFQYHSADKPGEQPWEPWLIGAPFGGADGIDSDFFKGGAYGQISGENQNTIPPLVCTPFGLESPVLGFHEDPEAFRIENEKIFKELWGIAFESQPEGMHISQVWLNLKRQLQPYLLRSLGYTPRPTNDVNLWAHSYGVGAMAKALAAALALDCAAARSAGKKVLFPLRSPELNLPLFSDQEADTYLLSPSVRPYDRDALIRQAQVKFKVLSILLRDTEKLHVGRRVGDILGYHTMRNHLFDATAKLLQLELAVGAEIFRDQAGIHFLLPWCQDSLDAGSKEGDPVPASGTSPRTQEELEEMVHEVVNVVFRGQNPPDWMNANKIYPNLNVLEKDPDFELVVHLGPNQEPIQTQIEDDQDKSVSQGLLFLKDRTATDKRLDREHPRDFPGITHSAEKQSPAQLCPICRKRAAPAGVTGANENNTPCPICESRREGRAGLWWELVYQNPSVATTTIWTAEASDNARRVNLLTLAFDLSQWFNGRAFDGFWMPNKRKSDSKEEVLPYLPIYPAPARIRGVWEASLDFLTEVKEAITKRLTSHSRRVFRISESMLNNSIKIQKGKGRMLEAMDSSGSNLGEWFLGRDKNENLWLLGLSGEGPDKKIETSKLLPGLGFVASDGKRIRVFREDTEANNLEPFSDLFPYLPMVEVLTDSPTRFQMVAPGSMTVEVLNLIQDLFVVHFGKVVHHVPFCASCLIFKEKFPFYLALAAADQAVSRELARARNQPREGVLDAQGLHVTLVKQDPARQFLGHDGQWTCLGPGQRDTWRSLVAEMGEGGPNTMGSFVGWRDAKSPDKFVRMKRIRFFPKMKGLHPDPNLPIFNREDLPSNKIEAGLLVCCPRLSWAHLASPGERHKEQLSIPLLSLRDWLASYEALARGLNRPCGLCRKELKGESALPVKMRAAQVRGLGSRRTQFRNLIEEILDVHARWGIGIPAEAHETLQRHIRSLISHPNACGSGWRRYAEEAEDAPTCPLISEIDDFLEDKRQEPAMKKMLSQQRRTCMTQAREFQHALHRMEILASIQGGEPLSVTYDLLAKVCGYEIQDPEPTQTGGK